MTRWSLRRRLGKSRDAEREYRPAAAAPVAGRPSPNQTSAGQLATDQAQPGQPPGGQYPASGWFEPGWGRPALPGPAQPGGSPYPGGEAGPAQPMQGQPAPGQPGSAPYGGAHYPGTPFAGSQYAGPQYAGTQYAGTQNPGPPYAGTHYSGGQPTGVAVLTPVPPAGPATPAGPPATGQQGAGLPGAGLPGAGLPGTGLPGSGLPGSGLPGSGLPGTVPPATPPSGTGQPPAAAPPAEPATWDVRAEPVPAEAAPLRAGGSWPDICDQFGLHLLVLAEQLRTSLDELEADEGDPERLRRLYQVDHAVTRMRRASRDLRTLAGRSEEELAGFTTSLLDVIRMAASAIERYTQVTVGRVTDLAVLGYAADDVGALMAALLDNATRYSPGAVTVSGHLLEDGGMMFRIEDTGIGIGADQVAALNATLAGPVPDVDERTGRHTGFPVVHRIGRKHSIGVRLAARPLPSSGTIAMVTLPPHLLCEVPAEEVQRRPAAAAAAPQAIRPTTVTDLTRAEPTRPQQWEPPELPDRDQPRPTGDLPRRERASLRGDEPRPQPRDQPPPPTPQQQAAARRAFAEELSAFTLGASLDAAAADDDIAIEEDAKP